MKRQRVEQHGAHYAKDRAVGADPESQREPDHGGEAGALP